MQCNLEYPSKNSLPNSSPWPWNKSSHQSEITPSDLGQQLPRYSQNKQKPCLRYAIRSQTAAEQSRQDTHIRSDVCSFLPTSSRSRSSIDQFRKVSAASHKDDPFPIVTTRAKPRHACMSLSSPLPTPFFLRHLNVLLSEVFRLSRL